MADMDLEQDGGMDAKRQAMITVNDLNYILEPDVSVAVNVTHKDHFFQSQTYTNQQRAICILNSGADYIDTTRSFLNFQLTVTATTGTAGTFAWFGENGSALNLINRITISSRSGDELMRIRRLNLLSATNCPYKMDNQWHRTVGDMMGHSASFPTTGAGIQNFSIPLYLLGDFFGYGRLMPAMLMSGLRIEIEWEARD